MVRRGTPSPYLRGAPPSTLGCGRPRRDPGGGNTYGERRAALVGRVDLDHPSVGADELPDDEEAEPDAAARVARGVGAPPERLEEALHQPGRDRRAVVVHG